MAGDRGLAVSAQGLSKRFGDRVASADVSLEVGQDEVFGFLGASGAGKTTAAHTPGTLIVPSETFRLARPDRAGGCLTETCRGGWAAG